MALHGAGPHWSVGPHWNNPSLGSLSSPKVRWARINKLRHRGANLYEADLTEANLRGANLRWADLRRAKLYDADLEEADLHGADLSDADLRGANLRGTNLQEADVRVSTWTYEPLSSTTWWDESTQWRVDFIPPCPKNTPQIPCKP
ncbi:hypothetical protein C2W62_31800 [Candidatus Entotheonella serta]|nr:hypothetical protein C2W62_31800 [Candidatus Entotheonella serta]